MRRVVIGILVLCLCGIGVAQDTSNSTSSQDQQNRSAASKDVHKAGKDVKNAGQETGGAIKDLGEKAKNKVESLDDQDATKVEDRFASATKAMDEIFNAPDKGIPENLLAKAQCVIMIPGMKKAGYVIGGRYGRGFATCRTPNGWSAPAPVFLGGGSVGLQIGGESVDVLMLVMNHHGVQQLLSTKFKIGADASAAAGPVGRSTSADTDVKFNSEILTYSRAKGVFAGVELNGAEIKQDMDSTNDLYGKDVSFQRILTGKVPPPASSKKFLAEVHQDFRESRASK